LRTILKGREPASLTEHRLKPGADYESYEGKEELRAALVTEQRGLCCYCMGKIPGKDGRMGIEHWHSHAKYPEEQLDYRNLLGVCKGSEGLASQRQHCDVRKADRELSRNPANRDHRVEDLIQYSGDGTVSSSDVTFNWELNEILNLNVPFLRANRKAVLEFFKCQAKRGTWSRSQVEKWLRDWNGDCGAGELRPFCQVVVYWLRKRLDRG
jgi:uncharacterized protein (TIGR02646 family)